MAIRSSMNAGVNGTGCHRYFHYKNTVNADFTWNLRYGCIRDTIDYFSWWPQWWISGNGILIITTSGPQNPQMIYATFGNKTAQLIVSNGTCRDSSEVKLFFSTITWMPALKPHLLYAPGYGDILKTPAWEISAAGTGILAMVISAMWNSPSPQTYPYSNVIRDVPVRLIVTNNIGCSDTAIQSVKVVGNCYIAVPNGFTPNGDGLNDYLYPTNAYIKRRTWCSKIFNRFGNYFFHHQLAI